MGQKPRHKPRRLGKKLIQIREALGLSQNQMLVKAGMDKRYGRNNLSNYELGKREPPSDLVLAYAKAAGLTVDAMLDDRASLPKTLKSVAKNTKTTKKRSQSS